MGIYREPKKKKKPELPFPRRRGPKGWLAQTLDPEGKDPPGTHGTTKQDKKNKLKSYKKFAARRMVLTQMTSKRKLGQMERLDWVSDKIRLGWPHRKIVLEFTRQFKMSKGSGKNYIEKTYKDFQKQFSDVSRRTVLMAEHCAVLKEAAMRAVLAEDFSSANTLLRQYAEVVGVLVPASMLSIRQEDNRQQIIVGGDEMKATLSSLEKLSEQDLFARAYKSNPQKSLPQGSGAIPLDVEEGAVSVPDR